MQESLCGLWAPVLHLLWRVGLPNPPWVQKWIWVFPEKIFQRGKGDGCFGGGWGEEFLVVLARKVRNSVWVRFILLLIGIDYCLKFSVVPKLGSIKISHCFVSLLHRNHCLWPKKPALCTNQKWGCWTDIVLGVKPKQGLKNNLGGTWVKQTIFTNLFDFWLQDRGWFLWKCENSWGKKDSCSQEHHLGTGEREKQALASLLGLNWSFGEGWVSERCEQSVVLVPDSIINPLGKLSSTISRLVLVPSSVLLLISSIEAPNSPKLQSCKAASLYRVQRGATRISTGTVRHCGNRKKHGKRRGEKPRDCGFYRVIMLSWMWREQGGRSQSGKLEKVLNCWGCWT